LIGVLFVAAASVEILVLANDPHGGEDLKDMLVGQILWVTPSDLIPVAAVYAGVLAVWVFGQRRMTPGGFYVLFAVAVTQSVQLVGIYLVFATLIPPALAGFGCRPRASLALGYGMAIAGYLVGIAGSAIFDLPTGPAIVCSLVVCALGMAVSRLRFFQARLAKTSMRP
jgi:zinc/manganese transport system permease protein